MSTTREAEFAVLGFYQAAILPRDRVIKEYYSELSAAGKIIARILRRSE
jgi:hypothetical protein